jgi:ribosome maturation factor RimP
MFVCLTQLETKVYDIINSAIEDMGYEIVRIRIHGTAKRKTLQIMLDRLDGSPLLLADCEKVSKHVSVLLDVEDPIEQNYSLEVSSPGIERPLTREKDFITYASEPVKLALKIGIEGRKKFNAQIDKVQDNELFFTELEERRNYNVLFSNVAEASVIFDEKLKNKLKSKTGDN